MEHVWRPGATTHWFRVYGRLHIGLNFMGSGFADPFTFCREDVRNGGSAK